MEITWSDILKDEKEKEYFKNVLGFSLQERQLGKEIYPIKENVFKAFELTTFSSIEVVILGQDPYHGAGQAEGLCFSVPQGVRLPPSLQNTFKELAEDFHDLKYLENIKNQNGHLGKWGEQGVFLLNSVLTVENGKPASHANKGWETFTDEVIRKISEHKSGVVFLLWGNYAKKKEILIDKTKHFILTAPHPSPFSVHTGFFGCKHFSKTNQILKQLGHKEIDWKIN